MAMLAAGATALAQTPRPKAEATPLTATDGVHAGGGVRIALRVTLPEGLHVQSDKPRDPMLIPTALALDAPAGVTLAEVIYPKATDLTQPGQPQPLAVFDHDFVVGARLAIERALPAGEIVIPARLHYQACDAATCYPPATAIARWTLRIVPASVVTPPLNPEVFDRIRFAAPRR